MKKNITNSVQNRRIKYLDVAKGIGILLMLIGHQPTFIPSNFVNWIYSFHMPMFFIIAGFLHRQYGSISSSIIHYIKRLLIPYYLICIVMMWINMISTGRYDLFSYYIGETINGEGATHIEWFLLCLFWGNIIVDVVIKKISKFDLQCLIITAGVFCSFFYSLIFENNLPLKIDSSLFSSGFIFVGYVLWNKTKYKESEMNGLWILLLGMVSILSCFAFKKIITDNTMILDIKGNVYSSVILNYGVAISGSLFILELSKRICSYCHKDLKSVKNIKKSLRMIYYFGGG